MSIYSQLFVSDTEIIAKVKKRLVKFSPQLNADLIYNGSILISISHKTGIFTRGEC